LAGAGVDFRGAALFVGDDFDAEVDLRATGALGVVDRDAAPDAVVAVRLRRAEVGDVRLAAAFFRWGLVPVAAMVTLSARTRTRSIRI
jgi:hypothetical protein